MYAHRMGLGWGVLGYVGLIRIDEEAIIKYIRNEVHLASINVAQ